MEQTYNQRMERRRRAREAKLRRQKRLRRIRTIGIAVAAFVVGIVGYKSYLQIEANGGLLERRSIVGIGRDEKRGEEAKYTEKDVVAPVCYEGEALDAKLESLAANSEDYKMLYDNRKQYPQELLSAVCNNADMMTYAKSYVKDEGKNEGGFSEKERKSQFPLLLQWDERWGHVQYGEDQIGLSGCAPTCLSMVIYGLTRDADATPALFAEKAKNGGYYQEGVGTTWKFLTDACEEYGVIGRKIELSKDRTLSELKKGHPIICSMRPGHFTTGGHFIALVGVEGDKLVVNDPNSRMRSQVLWSFETIQREAKSAWVYQNSDKATRDFWTADVF